MSVSRDGEELYGVSREKCNNEVIENVYKILKLLGLLALENKTI